ncbi:MAG: FxsA family protein [Paracoccaceae bacterium]
MWLFLAFLLVPILEIALFIQVGGLIGLWPTLAIVVLTAVAGTWLVRSQGRMALVQLQHSFQRLDNPSEPLAHGAMILISGALLLTPGFFTDAVGFALLVPQVRSAVFRYIAARVTVQSFEMGSTHMRRPPPGGAGGPIIDGEFEEVNPEPRPNAKPSGWVEDRGRH